MAADGNDDLILEAIFNPSQQGAAFDDEAEKCKECEIDEVIEAEVLGKVKQMEIDAVRAAEKGELEESLEILNNAINIAPTHASCFNNRAQLHRLKGDLEAAMEDLNSAIALSKGHGTVASQAFTQRGLLKKLQNDDDGSYHDFKMAAALGNQFAKSQVVNMNPYAALCNQMLREAVGKLQRGEAD